MMSLRTGIALAAIVVGGVAVAQAAPGPSAGRDTTSGTSVRKFQKDTLALRDELAAKSADLDDEYAKSTPDEARIATLEQDILDLQARIRTAAANNGVQSWGGRHHGRGMMYAWNGGPGGCGCW